MSRRIAVLLPATGPGLRHALNRLDAGIFQLERTLLRISFRGDLRHVFGPRCGAPAARCRLSKIAEANLFRFKSCRRCSFRNKTGVRGWATGQRQCAINPSSSAINSTTPGGMVSSSMRWLTDPMDLALLFSANRAYFFWSTWRCRRRTFAIFFSCAKGSVPDRTGGPSSITMVGLQKHGKDACSFFGAIFSAPFEARRPTALKKENRRNPGHQRGS